MRDLAAMRPRPFFLFLYLAVLPAMAQDMHVLDSLRRAYTTASTDTIRFKLLLGMAGEQLMAHPDSSFAYCLRAHEVAERTGRAEYLGEIEGWLGYLEEQRGRIVEAIEHYQTSLTYAERVN